MARVNMASHRVAAACGMLLASLGLGLCAQIAVAIEVGVAAAVNPAAVGIAPGQAQSTIVLGENIIFKERIRTSGSGLVQVLLNDGSTFTVGANSDLVIDEFVYDPAQDGGKLVVSFSKGVARFVGGKLSKNRGGVTINTPVGTLGIRGGIANIAVNGGQGTFSLLFGNELTFTGLDGKRRRVWEPGYTLTSNRAGTTEVNRTTAPEAASAQSALSGRPGQNGGANRRPGNQNVAASGLPRLNSDLGTSVIAPPIPSQAVQSTHLRNIGPALIQPNRLDQQRLRQVIEQEDTAYYPY